MNIRYDNKTGWLIQFSTQEYCQPLHDNYVAVNLSGLSLSLTADDRVIDILFVSLAYIA